MKSRLRAKPAGQVNLYGISIAFVVHSLDHSLFAHLILAYGVSRRYIYDIICTVIHEKWYNHSVDRSLSSHLRDLYRAHYPFA